MSERNGGSAFPADITDRGWVEARDGINIIHAPHAGMTLRDYFAAHAPPAAEWYGKYVAAGKADPFEVQAMWSYDHADAMLAERERERAEVPHAD